MSTKTMTIQTNVIKYMDKLKNKYNMSYSEVIKYLLIETGNWKQKK